MRATRAVKRDMSRRACVRQVLSRCAVCGLMNKEVEIAFPKAAAVVQNIVTCHIILLGRTVTRTMTKSDK